MQNFFAILHIVPKHDLQWLMKHDIWSFPNGSVVKNLPAMQETACSTGDVGSIPGLGRSPGKGNGNPLHYSCLDNFMDRRAWRATIHGFAKVGHDVGTKSHQPPPQMMMRNKWRNMNKERESGGPFFHHCVQNRLDLVAGEEGSD